MGLFCFDRWLVETGSAITESIASWFGNDEQHGKRLVILNIWRSVAPEPMSRCPLAVCDRQSIAPEDLYYGPNIFMGEPKHNLLTVRP